MNLSTKQKQIQIVKGVMGGVARVMIWAFRVV